MENTLRYEPCPIISPPIATPISTKNKRFLQLHIDTPFGCKRVKWNDTTSIYTAYSCEEYDRSMNKKDIARNMIHIRNLRRRYSGRKLRIDELMVPSGMCHIFQYDDITDAGPIQFFPNAMDNTNSDTSSVDILFDMLGDMFRSFGIFESDKTI